MSCRPMQKNNDTKEQAAYRAKKDALFQKWVDMKYLQPLAKFWSNHDGDNKIAVVCARACCRSCSVASCMPLKLIVCTYALLVLPV